MLGMFPGIAWDQSLGAFPRDSDVWRRNIDPHLKLRICLAEPIMTQGQGFGGVEVFLRNQLSPSKGYGYQYQGPCEALEISCIPFMQHCLMSFLLNSRIYDV